MSRSDPLVSVVIPYADRPEHLKTVLSAYRNQTYANMEIIVVGEDPSPPLKLQEELRKCGVHYYRNPYKHRYSRAAYCRNLGAARSEGDVLIISDVDVIPQPEVVQRVVDVYARNRKLAICARIFTIPGGLEAIKNAGVDETDELQEISTSMPYNPSTKWSTVDKVCRSRAFWWNFVTTLIAFRRDEFFQLLGLDPGFLGWGLEDQELAYRAVMHGIDIGYFEDIVGYHLDHAPQPGKAATAIRNFDYLIKKFPELADYPPLIEERTYREKILGASSVSLEDPLRARNDYRHPLRLLKHPARYMHRVCRRRKRNEESISIVIPVENYAVNLEETVLSCVYQTRPPAEVYLVIDPSEDRTNSLAQELTENFHEVHCIINNRRQALAGLRNQGSIASAFNYVMFLDTDTVLSPRYLEKVAYVLDHEPNVGFVYSNYTEYGQRNRRVNLPEFTIRATLIDTISGPGVAMMRRRSMEDTGGFDQEQIFQEWDLFLRMIEAGWRGKLVDEALYKFGVRRESPYLEASTRRKEAEDMIYEKHRLLYEQYGVGRSRVR
jgi:GT2 family glycosyltransferase